MQRAIAIAPGEQRAVVRARRTGRAAWRTARARPRDARSPAARCAAPRPPRARGTSCRRPGRAAGGAPRARARTAASRRRATIACDGRAGRRAGSPPAPARRDALGSVTRQPLCVTSQSTKAATASGSERVDLASRRACRSRRTAAAPAGRSPRAGRRSARAVRRERHVRRLGGDAPPPSRGAKAAFTASWIAGTERKLTVRCTTDAPAADELALDALVERRRRRAGSDRSTASDRRPGRACRAPVGRGASRPSAGSSAASRSSSSACSGSVSWNSSTKRWLQRACRLAAHARVVAHQVARPQEQIDEVETAGARLQPLVVLDQRPQVVAQQRRQLGARAAHEVVELALRGGAPHAAGGPVGIAIARESRPLPVPLARQRPQLGFQTVVVAAGDLLAPCDVGDEAFDDGHRAVAVVAPLVDRWRGTDGGQRLHERVDGRVTIEVLAAPRGREVAPLDEVPGGAVGGGFAARPAAACRGPAGGARAGRRDRATASCASNQRSKTRAKSRRATSSGATWNCGSTRASTGRSRSSSAQKEWIVPMRAASSCGSASSSRVRSAAGRPGWWRPRSMAVAQPELQLAGRRVGEGDRDHAVEPRATARERRQHAADQRRGLPRTRGSLHQERGREVVADAVAIGLIRQRYAHAGRQERP